MILYALACANGHAFESWFRDSAAYDHQIAGDLVACPECGSAQVTKSIMSPALRSRRPANPIEPVDGMSRGPDAGAGDVQATLLDAGRREIRDRLKAIRETILANTEDVGRRFPDEARRMHDGETAHRQISGEATPEEARRLLEDGVPILPIPTVADGLN